MYIYVHIYVCVYVMSYSGASRAAYRIECHCHLTQQLQGYTAVTVTAHVLSTTAVHILFGHIPVSKKIQVASGTNTTGPNRIGGRIVPSLNWSDRDTCLNCFSRPRGLWDLPSESIQHWRSCVGSTRRPKPPSFTAAVIVLFRVGVAGWLRFSSLFLRKGVVRMRRQLGSCAQSEWVLRRTHFPPTPCAATSALERAGREGWGGGSAHSEWSSATLSKGCKR